MTSSWRPGPKQTSCAFGTGPQAGQARTSTRIRRSVIEGGRFYLVQTPLRRSTWLRVTMMNPFTTESDLVELVEELRRTAGTTGPLGQAGSLSS
jgi:hypothetical protein